MVGSGWGHSKRFNPEEQLPLLFEQKFGWTI